MKDKLITTTILNKEWLKKTNAKPTQIAICCCKGKLLVTSIFWYGNDGGCWDDENALAMPNTVICNLPANTQFEEDKPNKN